LIGLFVRNLTFMCVFFDSVVMNLVSFPSDANVTFFVAYCVVYSCGIIYWSIFTYIHEVVIVFIAVCRMVQSSLFLL
jgi:hypothetical protein